VEWPRPTRLSPLVLCLITDGMDLDRIAFWLLRGVDFVQIRERGLEARALADLTRKVMALPNPHGTKILVNDRADVALACGAHGVHLRDGSVLPEAFAGLGLTISVACHSADSVRNTRGADLILLAPIFVPRSKAGIPLGLGELRKATGLTDIPVLALGGVTESNARECVEAGAAGVAGISLFRMV